MKRNRRDNKARKIIRVFGLIATCIVCRIIFGYIALAIQTGLVATYQAVTHFDIETGTIRNYLFMSSIDVAHIVLEGVLITAVVKLIHLYILARCGKLAEDISEVNTEPLKIWPKLWVIFVGALIMGIVCLGATSLQKLGASVLAFFGYNIQILDSEKSEDYLFLLCEGWLVLQIMKFLIWNFHRRLRRKAKKERG